MKRYPLATACSFTLVIFLACFLCYLLGKIYPDFRLFDNLLSKLGVEHNQRYNFYTGRKGGAYYAIGKAIDGKFADDNDSIINCPKSGGYENAMKLTIEENSFGLIQEEIINHDAQLQKNVRIITPLFLERMHIFYRTGLFQNCKGMIQLSASTDSSILRCFSDSVENINVGPVGSGTRILASYVLAFIAQQIHKTLNVQPKYEQTDEPFKTVFKKMLHANTADSSLDIMFYVGADPIDMIKNVLDSGNYSLLSVDPSFVVLLNKEYDLSLRISDFKNKYDQSNDISTIATLAYLITSKSTRDDDVLRLLKKIDTSKATIHRSLIHLPSTCSDLCYSQMIDSCRYKLPLVEFGFFNAFHDEYEASHKLQWKELAAFLFSMVTLFFPVFRSVGGIVSILEKWFINKQIDGIAYQIKKMNEENSTLSSHDIFVTLSELKAKTIDLYGDGILSEAHYNALIERINMHLEKFGGEPNPEINVKILGRNENAITATS